MQRNIVADRYAEALLSIEYSNITALESDLKLISKIISENHMIKEFFTSPKIVSEDKKKVIQKVFENSLNEGSLRFLMFLIDKKRESELENIYEQFLYLADQQLNRIRVSLDIPKDFSSNIHSQITEKVAGLIRKNQKDFNLGSVNKDSKFEFITKVDERMLGGIRVRVGDQYLDASVSSYLENWKKKAL